MVFTYYKFQGPAIAFRGYYKERRTSLLLNFLEATKGIMVVSMSIFEVVMLVFGLHYGRPNNDQKESWGGQASDGASPQESQRDEISVETSLHRLLHMCKLVTTFANAPLNFLFVGSKHIEAFKLTLTKVTKHQPYMCHIHLESSFNLSYYQLNYGT